MESAVLEPVQAVLRSKRSTVATKQRHHWKPTTKEELIVFFISRFIEGLMKFVKHNLSLSYLELLSSKLIPPARSAVLHSALAVELEHVSDMAATITTIMHKYVANGAVYCVDETIFAHYGSVAESQGLLSYIPGKPYKYGMLSYVLAQQFEYTRLPFTAAILPKFTSTDTTPIRSAIRLLRSANALSNNPAEPHSVVLADSLWAHPACWSEFTSKGVMYVTPLRADCKNPPPELHQLASKGLKRTWARTYMSADRATLLQVIGASKKNLTLVTSAFAVGEERPPPPPRKYNYRTAKAMLTMTSEQLITDLELDPDKVITSRKLLSGSLLYAAVICYSSCSSWLCLV